MFHSIYKYRRQQPFKFISTNKTKKNHDSGIKEENILTSEQKFDVNM